MSLPDYTALDFNTYYNIREEMGIPTGERVMRDMPLILADRYDLFEVECRALCLSLCGEKQTLALKRLHRMLGVRLVKITLTSPVKKSLAGLTLSDNKMKKISKDVALIRKALRSRADEVKKHLDVLDIPSISTQTNTPKITLIFCGVDNGKHFFGLLNNGFIKRIKNQISSTVKMSVFDAVEVTNQDGVLRVIKSLGYFDDNKDVITTNKEAVEHLASF